MFKKKKKTYKRALFNRHYTYRHKNVNLLNHLKHEPSYRKNTTRPAIIHYHMCTLSYVYYVHWTLVVTWREKNTANKIQLDSCGAGSWFSKDFPGGSFRMVSGWFLSNYQPLFGALDKNAGDARHRLVAKRTSPH